MKRRNLEEQIRLAKSFERSELNGAEFSSQLGIHPDTLRRWCQKRREQRESKAVTAEFTEAKVIEDASTSKEPEVEVALPFGVTLRFFGVQ